MEQLLGGFDDDALGGHFSACCDEYEHAHAAGDEARLAQLGPILGMILAAGRSRGLGWANQYKGNYRAGWADSNR